ncbi:MAG: hypothetical protein ACFB20_12815 [Opitutales bacterium]
MEPLPPPKGSGGRTLILVLVFLVSVGAIAYSLWPTEADDSKGESESKTASQAESASKVDAHILTNETAAQQDAEAIETPAVEPVTVAANVEVQATQTTSHTVANSSAYAHTGQASFGAMDGFLDTSFQPEIVLVPIIPYEEKEILYRETMTVRSLMRHYGLRQELLSDLPEIELPPPAVNERGRMRNVIYRRYTDAIQALGTGERVTQLEQLLEEMNVDLENMKERVARNPSSDPVLVNDEQLTVDWLLDAIRSLSRQRLLVARREQAALAQTRAFEVAQANWQNHLESGAQILHSWIVENTLASQLLRADNSFTIVGDKRRDIVLLKLKLKNGAFVYLPDEDVVVERPKISDLRLIVTTTSKVN